MVPFIIFALPRSRTRWLSEFLTYGDYQCAHDQARFVRGVDDVRGWLRQNWTGTVETGAARWWRLARRLRPDARIAVVRRPVDEIVESALKLDMQGVCTFDRLALTRELNRMDRALDRIALEPGVLSVSFRDLADEATCATLFEHCLPYRHDHDWWESIAPVNTQGNMRALMRYCFANKPQIERAAAMCRRELRRGAHVVSADLSGVTIQTETFETFWRDGQTLFAEHAAEVGGRDGVTLNPNVALARRMEAAGSAQIMTGRDGGRMVGYLVTLISPSLEDASLVVAMQNTFFVSRRYRGLGPHLQRESLARLERRGVGEVIFRAGVRGSGPKLGVLYERLGAKDYGQLYNLVLKKAA